MNQSFRCKICGEIHSELPHIGLDRPDHWWDVPEAERGKRIELTSDTCIIDNESFFIRGVIEIPVLDDPDGFGFGVWVSHKKENFYNYLEHFDSDSIGPFFGWLCTRIHYYNQDTLSLKTTAHYRGKGIRPLITINACDHPLYFDQRDGIALQKAWEIIHFYDSKFGDGTNN